MVARQNYYQEATGTVTTTSVSSTLVTTLTFTPDANSDYWLFASGGFTYDSGTDNHVGQVTVYHDTASTTLNAQTMQHKRTEDVIPFLTIAKLSFGASPTSQSIKVFLGASNSGDTATIKDVRLLAIKADAADEYAEALSQQSTSNTASYTSALALNFTPATTGDYLVIGNCTRASDVNLGSMYCQLNDVGHTTTYGGRIWSSVDDFDAQPFVAAEKITCSGSIAQTFQLEWKSGDGTLAYVEYSRILALRLDAFENVYFTSLQTDSSSTAGASFFDHLTLTATPLAFDHAILMFGAGSCTSGANYANYHTAKSGTEIELWTRQAAIASSWISLGMAQRQTLAASSTTWTWSTKSSVSGVTSRVGGLSIAVLQLGSAVNPITVSPTGFTETASLSKPPVAVPFGTARVSGFGSPTVVNQFVVAPTGKAVTAGFGTPGLSQSLMATGLGATVAFGGIAVAVPFGKAMASGKGNLAVAVPHSASVSVGFGGPSVDRTPQGSGATAGFGGVALAIPTGVSVASAFGSPTILQQGVTAATGFTAASGFGGVAVAIPHSYGASVAFGSATVEEVTLEVPSSLQTLGGGVDRRLEWANEHFGMLLRRWQALEDEKRALERRERKRREKEARARKRALLEKVKDDGAQLEASVARLEAQARVVQVAVERMAQIAVMQAQIREDVVATERVVAKMKAEQRREERYIDGLYTEALQADDEAVMSMLLPLL